jgi:hypothetical protein
MVATQTNEEHGITAWYSLRMSGRNSGNDSSVDFSPKQLIIVGRIELGPAGLKLKPDVYRIALPHKALLNRPPNDSEWLQLTFSGSEQIMFEIVP